MQEDFPCLGDTGSYEMIIESDDQISPRKNKYSLSNYDSSFLNQKEAEILPNKKAIIELDNAIKLSLSTHMTREEISLQSIQSFDQNTIQKQGENEQVYNTEPDQHRLQISSKVLHQDQKITTIVEIKLQNECINIINEMYLTNKLEKNSTLSSERQLSSNTLTQKNLLSLINDSEKKFQNYNQHQIRKVSNNSNDSDATLPLIQNLYQSDNSNFEFLCFNCGENNTISNVDQQKQHNISYPICQTESQSDFSQKNLENIQEIHNQRISEQIKQNSQPSKIFNSLDSRTKGYKNQELSFNIEQKQTLKNKTISLRRRKINVSPQQAKIRTEQKNFEKKQTMFEDNNKQDRLKQQYNLENSVSFDDKIEINNNSVQYEDRSFQASQRFISTAQQVQTESVYNKFLNQNNQEFAGVITSNNENLILKNLQINNIISNCQEINNSQSISIEQQNGPEYTKNRKSQKINLYQNQQTVMMVENDEIKKDEIKNKSIKIEKGDQNEQQVQVQYDYQDEEHSSDYDQEDQTDFSDDTIAKTEKKNVVKNFVKAFISFVNRDESQLNNINLQQNSQLTIKQKLKKFQNYMKKYKFNNQFIKQLISNCEYSQIFQYFMIHRADDWLKNSNVQNKETHRQMLAFFKKSISDSDQLNKLKVLKKNKRIVNSSNNKIQFTPITADISQINSNSCIKPFSPVQTVEQPEIDYVSIIEKQIKEQKIISQETIQEIENDDLKDQKELKQQINNQIQLISLNSIQNVLNGIQINNLLITNSQKEQQINNLSNISS